MRIVLAVVFILAMSMAVPAMAADYPVHFAWDANTETDLAGYRLYQSNASGQYQIGEGNEIASAGPGDTSLSISISEEKTYYWVLTAYDTAGNESDKSNEVSYTLEIPDITPPNAPAGLNITVNITFNLTSPQVAVTNTNE